MILGEVMNMRNKLTNLSTVFSLLQGATIASAAGGSLLAIFMLRFGVEAVAFDDFGLGRGIGFWLLAISGFATVFVLSACCLRALHAFYRLCSRVKRGSAFTRENEAAMALIARQCVISGGTLIAACGLIWLGDVLDPALLRGLYWFEMLFLAVCFLAVALIAWALCLLVRRAVPLQEDSDLTV